MLTERLIDSGFFLLNSVLNLLDVLPDMPTEVIIVLDTLLSNMIDYGWGAVCFFVPLNLVRVLLPLVLLVVNFEHVYHLIMWVLRKIPVVGIE